MGRPTTTAAGSWFRPLGEDGGRAEDGGDQAGNGPAACPGTTGGSGGGQAGGRLDTRQQQIRSLMTEDGTLEVSLRDAPVPEPGPDEVLIRVEAAPVNPSDLGLLLAG